ncbi:D-aminoacyl-tRNA deacylase isoform X6 [Nomia melanderi]|uniref:D-aminoacyl-tRNA deacylase isoform X6 n=1 Tax=Nomia melanderi TaxID=2448451 RepID=UPI003FCD1977
MENINEQKEIEEPHIENVEDISPEEEKTENTESQKSEVLITDNEPPNLQSREIQTDIIETETVEQLKNQLDTLMNSLATLSAEKSKMEANFQMDKKQLRNERDECEKVIKDLREKLRKAQTSNHSEIEHVKCKLIMERHEREKEQADHAKMLKYVIYV